MFWPKKISDEKELGARHGGKARVTEIPEGGKPPQTPISKNLPFRGKFFEMIKTAPPPQTVDVRGRTSTYVDVCPPPTRKCPALITDPQKFGPMLIMGPASNQDVRVSYRKLSSNNLPMAFIFRAQITRKSG